MPNRPMLTMRPATSDGERLTGAEERRRPHAAMSAMTGVRLAELLGRLSLAADISSDAGYGRGVRTVVLAVELGRLARASDDDLHDTFWVSLLGYLGCTGLTGDEASEADGSDVPVNDNSIRLAQIVGAGSRVLSALSRPPAVDAMDLPARLFRIAQAGEQARLRHGQADRVAVVRRPARVQLDPLLLQVFAAGRDRLFAALEDPQIFDRFLELEPKPLAFADNRRVDEVARVLGMLADLRCPLFLGHSVRVAALAERAASQMGLDPEATRSLRRAALLHDVGRLGVPNGIWMRPGRLDWGEMERVRLHAYYTERVLSPIPFLGPVAEIAGAAHERLDGSGYPQNRIRRSLLPAVRILAAADMAVAMSEARPYRPALSPADIARELVAEVSAGRLDATATDAVLACLGMKIQIVPSKAHPVSDRELEVCRLIARGKMNKEIAEVLGISLRTVQNHIAHIFDKLGLHTRAGVAVWLVENDLD